MFKYNYDFRRHRTKVLSVHSQAAKTRRLNFICPQKDE